MQAAGFTDCKVVEKPSSRTFIKEWLPGSGARRTEPEPEPEPEPEAEPEPEPEPQPCPYPYA